MNGVSVIVCCYNSADRIEETLTFLQSQKIGTHISWEVIVVNNGSHDNTREIVCKQWIGKQGHPPIHLFDEHKAGLIYARIKGIEEAIYDLVVFCDDDNHLDENYIASSYALMHQKADVAIAGGLIKPKLPFYPGKWIEANYGALAIGAVAPQSGYVAWVFGAGMVVRKSIFNELKSKGIVLMLTGRLGAKQTSGDDAELCQFARFLGHKIYYSQELVLHHNISAHRLTRWNFIKANYKNVYMVVYFYLLDKLIASKEMKPSTHYFDFLLTRLGYVVYFLPRVFLGKNNFYSFMMFFQNIQLLVWTFLRRKRFMETYENIRTNLYHGKG